MFKQKFTTLISAIIFLCLPATVFAMPVDRGFTPNKIIDDKVFSDTQTFGGADGVQKFLEKKHSVLANISPDFITRLKELDSTALKQDLEDPRPNLGRLRSASELIWDASLQSGLNPQVILASLNKEQGLITAKTDLNEPGLQRALDFAMGFGCPDSTGCSSSQFGGFYSQLFGTFDSGGNRYLGAAKSLMKSFSTPGGRGPQVNGRAAKVGDVIILDNTLGGYDGISPQQSLMIENNATAALYRYTPHVFNGNYNFWKYFQQWFKYPNGALLKLASSGDTYIIQNGVKLLVPQFVAQARKIDLTAVITVSPNEFESYDTDKPLGPADNTIVTVAGDAKKYVFLENIKHPASDLVIKQRGLDPAKTLSVTAQEAQIFDLGSVLTPKDGTIIRGVADKSVYLVSDGKIKMFSAYTFNQRNIKPKDLYTVPDAEILSYAQNGFVPPLDGTLIKTASSGTVYYAQNGYKQAVTAELFKNRGWSFKQVATLSGDEVEALTLGAYAQPKDRSFFAVGSKQGALYIFKDGTKHNISSFVAKQRGITADYVFPSGVVVSWYEGIPVAPRDGTVLKGDSDATVYLVMNGQLRPLTYKAYQNRRLSPKKTTVLSQAEIDSYGKGDTLEK